MKMRYRVKCEKCKLMVEVGQRGTRFHGRIWHLDCALHYQQQRRIERGELTPA